MAVLVDIILLYIHSLHPHWPSFLVVPFQPHIFTFGFCDERVKYSIEEKECALIGPQPQREPLLLPLCCKHSRLSYTCSPASLGTPVWAVSCPCSSALPCAALPSSNHRGNDKTNTSASEATHTHENVSRWRRGKNTTKLYQRMWAPPPCSGRKRRH